VTFTSGTILQILLHLLEKWQIRKCLDFPSKFQVDGFHNAMVSKKYGIEKERKKERKPKKG